MRTKQTEVRSRVFLWLEARGDENFEVAALLLSLHQRRCVGEFISAHMIDGGTEGFTGKITYTRPGYNACYK